MIAESPGLIKHCIIRLEILEGDAMKEEKRIASIFM